MSSQLKLLQSVVAGSAGKSAEPKDVNLKGVNYAAQNDGRTLTPAQKRRLRKTRNRTMARAERARENRQRLHQVVETDKPVTAGKSWKGQKALVEAVKASPPSIVSVTPEAADAMMTSPGGYTFFVDAEMDAKDINRYRARVSAASKRASRNYTTRVDKMLDGTKHFIVTVE